MEDASCTNNEEDIRHASVHWPAIYWLQSKAEFPASSLISESDRTYLTWADLWKSSKQAQTLLGGIAQLGKFAMQVKHKKERKNSKAHLYSCPENFINYVHQDLKLERDYSPCLDNFIYCIVTFSATSLIYP